MINVDVIIVNWNSGQLLMKCLASIRQSNNINANVVVVDNASSDSSLTDVGEIEGVRVISLNKNVGFAAACNIGWRASSSQLVLFLNPDTQINPDTLYKSCNFITNNPQITVLGVQYIDCDGVIAPSCSRFPRAWNYLWDVLGFSKLSPRWFHHATVAGVDTFDYRQSGYVDEVSGAFYLIRRSDLEKFQGFDERFFVYYEELDLSRRIINSGGLIFFNSDINIIHVGGGTTNGVRGLRLFYELRSRLLYSKKHHLVIEYIIILLITVSEFFSRFIYLLTKKKFGDIRELILAYKLLFKFLLG